MTEQSSNNVIVMSEAGKPIFSRFGSPGQIARICGLIQALRTAIRMQGQGGNNQNNTQSAGALSVGSLGDIQSLQSHNLCIVFMTVGSITLVSISKRATTATSRSGGNDDDNTINDDVMETETYSRLRLEYIYAHLILMLTTNIQNIFIQNPAFDLRSMISSSDNLLRGILDATSPELQGNTKAGPYLVAGVQSCFPLSYKLRHHASKVIQTIAGRIENQSVLFALLIVGDRLVTVVQPSYRPQQLRVSDLHLILNFITKQPGLFSSAELWLPLCLPRFNASGFLYAYTHCFDIPSRLTLILLSAHNTTEQFQLLRTASQTIREQLGIPAVSDSVLKIMEELDESPESKSLSSFTNNNMSIQSSDVGWKRSNESESVDNSNSDEEYVNISTTDTIGNNSISIEEGGFVPQVRQSLTLSSLDQICDKYLENHQDDATSLLHFLFRLDVPVVDNKSSFQRKNKKQHHHKSGYLSQCISPAVPVLPPFDTVISRRRLFNNYQKLSLRLRLGSATVESSVRTL